MNFDEVFDEIDKFKDRKLNGYFNCIPWPYPRFRSVNPGIEQGMYYLITGNTKAGKSQITDDMFVLNPIKFVHNNPKSGIELKIIYFNLEMTTFEKKLQMSTYALFRAKDVRLAPKDLMSKGENRVLSDLHRNMLDSLKPRLKVYEEYITYIDHIKNPYGIYKYCREYFDARGKTVELTDSRGEKTKTYKPDNPNLYTIIIVDNANIISTEKDHPTLYSSIGKLSNYLMTLRNNYKAIPVLIQQQDPANETMQNVRANMTEPSLGALRDNKSTAMDANFILGIYSPFRNSVGEYHDYDIFKYRDHFRSLKVLGGRSGGIGELTSLFFDGAVNFFTELPHAGRDIKFIERAQKIIKNLV